MRKRTIATLYYTQRFPDSDATPLWDVDYEGRTYRQGWMISGFIYSSRTVLEIFLEGEALKSR